MSSVNPPMRNPAGSEGQDGTQAASEAKLAPSLQVSGWQLRPLQVTWEITQACDWKSSSGRVNKRSHRQRDCFSTAECFHLIEEVAALNVPLLALTGGDPLRRPDLFPVIEFASGRSVRTSLTLLPTPNLDRNAIEGLKNSGLMRVSFWIHGSTATLDEAYWKIPGTYRRTLEAIGWCHEEQLPVQINTVIVRRNLHDADAMIELLTRLDVAMWNVFFFVPKSPDDVEEMLTPDEHEQVFAKLYAASRAVHFQIKTTEGQPYLRYLLQQQSRQRHGRKDSAMDLATGTPKRVNEGNGYLFISHLGEVYPSRFLPLSGGNVMTQPLADIYRESPLFISLRDPSKLKGKCGQCGAREVCGGSRARAYALTGDLFAPDPCCAYQP